MKKKRKYEVFERKRKYVRRRVTTNLLIERITSIRTRNNKQWMALLLVAFRARPRIASKIMAQITRNDTAVTRLMTQLGKKNAK